MVARLLTTAQLKRAEISGATRHASSLKTGEPQTVTQQSALYWCESHALYKIVQAAETDQSLFIVLDS